MMHRARFQRIVAIACAVFLALVTAAAVLLGGGAASAQPALDVSKPDGKVLLGDQASITITVTNSGDQRGYNLSLSDTFSSLPAGKAVTFVSASTPDGPVTPTSVSTDPITKELTVTFDDIRDLGPGESTTITIVVFPDTGADPTWAVGDVLRDEVTAAVSVVPDGSGDWIEGSDTADYEVIPYCICTKTANQSTGIEQATGCGSLVSGSWPYSYTITVQNNFVNPAENVVVSDALPDGIEYLGMVSGDPPDAPPPAHDPVSGETAMQWTVGTLAAGETWTVTYGAGIRYDYFGTANGGTNRPYDEFPGAYGTKVPNKTPFENTAVMNGTYLGTPYSDEDSASVTAAYATVRKSAATVPPGPVVNGTTVTFTLTGFMSEYYQMTQAPTVTDVLPDGMTYVDGSESVPYDSMDFNPATGETTIVWSDELEPFGPGDDGAITFQATVDDTWDDPPDENHTWIVAGDSMTNRVTLDADWEDTVGSGTGTTQTTATAGVTLARPTLITKEISKTGDAGSYSGSAEATVGDTLWFRVRFNTTDGANPATDDLQFGNIEVVDWIPRGTEFVSGSESLGFSDSGDFNYGTGFPPEKFPSNRFDDSPAEISSGSLDGLGWSLGTISAGGWWEVVFRVTVTDDTGVVVDGNVFYDYGKLSGERSDGNQYTDRDAAPVTYTEPDLDVDKEATSVPDPLQGGDDVDYRITLTNSGTATAQDVLVVDTLPEGMWDSDPSASVVVTQGVDTLVLDTDYTVSWNGTTGELVIDFYDEGPPVIDTPIPPAPDPDSVVTIDYTATVDSDVVGAGLELTNTADVTWWTQVPGTTPRREYSGSASETVSLERLSVAKSIDGSSTVVIGDTVTYRIQVTVPEQTTAYSPRIRDVVTMTGLEYVSGSSTLNYVSGTPVQAAAFPGSSDPDGTFTWTLGDIDNSTPGAGDYVFYLEFDIEVTGLINPAGDPDDQDNWAWWWNTGGNPTVVNTVNDRGRVTWSDGTETWTQTTSQLATLIQQPNLDLTKENNTTGPVAGGSDIVYTVTIDNSGTSTAWNNIFVDTVDPAMRATDPTTIVPVAVTLDMTPLVLDTDYTVSWNGATGELEIDLTDGTGGETEIPSGSRLVIVYAARVDADVGAGDALRNIASVEFSSQDDEMEPGRHVPLSADTDDHNTDDSSAQVQEASISKSNDAPSGIVSIYTPYTYTVSVVVPADTTIFSSEVTDTMPDGLTVIDVTPSTGTADFVPQPDGTTDVTWDIGDYVNDTGSPVTLTLAIDVRVNDSYTTGGEDVKDGDVFNNTSTLTWEDSQGRPYEDSDGDSATVREPDISVTKGVDNPTPEAGDTVTYTIQVTNNGQWPAYNALLDDTVDSRLTYVPGSITGAGADASAAPDLTWDIQAGHGPVAPSETLTMSFQATVNGGLAMGTVIPNTARVPSYTNNPQEPARDYGPTDSNTVDVTVRAPVLSLQKTVTANPNPNWYEVTTFQVTVTNNGDAAARNVDVRDTIPSPRFSYVAGSTAAVWPGGSSSAEPAGAPGPDLTWGLSAELNPAESLVLTFNMLTGQWAAHGLHTNTATASAEDGAGSPVPDATNTADINVKQVYGVTVEKALEDGDGYVPVGSEFSYTITVTNIGNTTIPAVPIEDAYDTAYLEYVSAAPAPDDDTPGSLLWDDITGGDGLAPQESASVTVTFVGLQPGAKPLTNNTASVDTLDDQGNPVIGSDTDDSLTLTDPSLELTKTLDDKDGFVPVGGKVSYNIRLENTGDTVIKAPVTLHDSYNPAYLEFESAVPAPDISTAGLISWSNATSGADLAPGQHADVSVTFTALKAGKKPNTVDNVEAFAFDEHGDPLAGDDSNDELVITDPRLTVVKRLAEGQPGKVKVGQEVRFVVEVTNTGDTMVPSPIPLKDIYNRAYLGFRSASPKPVSEKDDGRLDWTDISGGKGLAPGSSVSVELTFQALREGTSPGTRDVATVSGAVDEHGDPVAPDSDNTYVDVGETKVIGATRWFLAEGSTGGGFDTWILLQNPQGVNANVGITFTTQDGPRDSVPIVVPAKSRATVRIQNYVPDDFHVSSIVESDVPIVAERSMYWDRRYWGESGTPGNPEPYEMKGGHSTLGVPLSSTGESGAGIGKELYFPEGATGGGFDSWVLLCNPGDTTANVKVSCLLCDGSEKTETVAVAPRSRQTVHLDLIVPDALEVATEVVSDVTIVAERSTYWDPEGERLQPYEMRDGHSSPGTNSLDREWFLSEGSTGEGFETFIQVINPQEESAKIKATFLNEEGTAAEKEMEMPARSRATLRISDYVPDDFHVSTVLTSDRPVAAERSQYWDRRATGRVVAMRGGHANTGVTYSGTLWSVPEGSTGGGFDSWVLIANPTEGDAVATITFMTHSGPREPFDIEVPAHTRYTVRVGDHVVDDFHVSTLVESETELVVERAMYWDKRERAGIQPYEMMGGHSASGVDP